LIGKFRFSLQDETFNAGIHMTTFKIFLFILLPVFIFVRPGKAQQPADDLFSRIDEAVAVVMSDVIEWRRDLHQHPELSNREFRTSAIVAGHLRSLGMEVQTGVAGTGVVALLRSGV